MIEELSYYKFPNTNHKKRFIYKFLQRLLYDTNNITLTHLTIHVSHFRISHFSTRFLFEFSGA
jgi:hypothetical protein